MTTTQNVSHAKPKAAAKKPTKQQAAAAAVAKMRQASLNIPAPSTPPSELMMVPLTLIETRKQVRTTFDEASLQELAQDIAVRGVLQPILLRPNPGMANYLVIAGERRLRAARLAQLDTIPAIIGEVDNDTASMMQLAENIQREDLGLADEAAAVRKLYDLVGGSVTAAAERLHKSKAWVSKRLAASCPNLAWQARQLLDECVTEDLEIVLTVDKIAQLCHWESREIAEAVKKGQAGRQTVREKLDEVKARIEAEKAEQEQARQAAETEAASPEAKAQREQKAHERAVEAANEAERRRLDPNILVWDYDCGDLADDQRQALSQHLEKIHERGKKDTPVARLQKVMEICCDNKTAAIEIAAYVAGSQDILFDLTELIEVTMDAEQH
ncbi:MAG: ParB/RepB/Spo0J family partition protein [Rhodocyclaceae bacterium]|nr:ParB/RepB/Spo0J family partition protein [Rhodocyclaceae bacterium]